MNLFQKKIIKYEAWSFMFLILKGFTKFLGFSAPLIFMLFFLGLSFWICLSIAVVFVLLIRILWVYFDSKHRTYEIVHEHLLKEKENFLKNNFK